MENIEAARSESDDKRLAKYRFFRDCIRMHGEEFHKNQADAIRKQADTPEFSQETCDIVREYAESVAQRHEQTRTHWSHFCALTIL